MTLEIAPVPCSICGHSTIEVYATERRGWFVGCRPCSEQHDWFHSHAQGATREQAITRWNNTNTVEAW